MRRSIAVFAVTNAASRNWPKLYALVRAVTFRNVSRSEGYGLDSSIIDEIPYITSKRRPVDFGLRAGNLLYRF